MEAFLNKFNEVNIQMDKNDRLSLSKRQSMKDMTYTLKSHFFWTSILFTAIVYFIFSSIAEKTFYLSLIPASIYFIFRLTKYFEIGNKIIIKEFFSPVEKQKESIIKMFYTGNLVESFFSTIYKNPYNHVFLQRLTIAIELKVLSFEQIVEAVRLFKNENNNSLFHQLVAKNGKQTQSNEANEAIRFFQKNN